jgi:hypothetical protein
MKKRLAVILLTFLMGASAQAELRRAEIKVFGMD